MRSSTIHDVNEFAPENYAGDPNTDNISETPGTIIATSDGHYWIQRPDGTWGKFILSRPLV